ncbi:hypothetical protein [Spirulina sp. 06S082]|uniref:hypothetical protein n=1 Tax=Spirulina sp. 06S082 TaxID=3110248 RepID=UPI002B1EC975|nr:hypothetical protein [Spirulina sp. 06S082]MEA5467580.1 hypothetical protein [Spirulina sp. 06S082]
MSKPFYEIVDNLPTGNITVKALNALDFVVPGEWENIVGFKNTIRQVTGEDDDDLVHQIGERVIWLYNDKSEGYQRALWLYQTIDSTGTALGAAAMANKVGEKIGFLGFLNTITPKADKAQSIDLCLKLVVELLTFCSINGIPGDNIGDFVKSLADYGGESIMRMAALVCFDGMIPLGPDFIQKAQETIAGLSANELEKNPAFSKVSDMIPGKNSSGKLDFIGNSFGSVTGWMNNFVESKNLSVDRITEHLSKYIEIADDKLDYLAAFLDMTTNYYEHTGTQTIAKHIIDRAYAEI